MMDLRGLFAAPVQNAPKKKSTQPAQSEQIRLPPPTAPKAAPKASTSSVSSDHSRESKGNLKSKNPKRAVHNRPPHKRQSNLKACPAPYDGASNFTTLEELSRKRIETSDLGSDTEQQQDVVSESSVVDSQQRDEEEIEEHEDDDVKNFECDDTQSVRSGISVRSVKSTGTKSVCSARSGTSVKETKVKARRKPRSKKAKTVALVYEEY